MPLATEQLVARVTADISDYIRKMGAAGQGAEAFGKKSENVNSRILRSIGKTVAAYGGMYFGIRGIIRGVTELVDTERRLSRAMGEVWTITDKSASQMKTLRGQLIGVASQYGADQVDTIRAYYQTVSAGVTNSASAMHVLREASMLALAGLSTQTQAVDVLTTVMNSYGTAAGDVRGISDALFTTVRLGKTRLEELAATLGRIAPIAAAAGVSFDEVSAGMALLTSRGMQTDLAMTAMRATISSILSPAEETKQAAKEMGVDFSATALASKGLVGFMSDLSKVIGGNAEVAAKFFQNIRALPGVLTMTSDNGQHLVRMFGELEKKTGATEHAALKMMSTTDFAWRQFISGWEKFKSDVSGGAAEIIRWMKGVTQESIDGAMAATRYRDAWAAFWKANASASQKKLFSVGKLPDRSLNAMFAEFAKSDFLRNYIAKQDAAAAAAKKHSDELLRMTGIINSLGVAADNMAKNWREAMSFRGTRLNASLGVRAGDPEAMKTFADQAIEKNLADRLSQIRHQLKLAQDVASLMGETGDEVGSKEARERRRAAEEHAKFAAEVAEIDKNVAIDRANNEKWVTRKRIKEFTEAGEAYEKAIEEEAAARKKADLDRTSRRLDYTRQRFDITSKMAIDAATKRGRVRRDLDREDIMGLRREWADKEWRRRRQLADEGLGRGAIERRIRGERSAFMEERMFDTPEQAAGRQRQRAERIARGRLSSAMDELGAGRPESARLFLDSARDMMGRAELSPEKMLKWIKELQQAEQKIADKIAKPMEKAAADFKSAGDKVLEAAGKMGAAGNAIATAVDRLRASLPGRQHGGWIDGPGGTDRVPAMLTAGEFVVNKRSAAKHAGLVQAINADKYASGGWVPSWYGVRGYAGGGRVVAGSDGGGIVPGGGVQVNMNVERLDPYIDVAALAEDMAHLNRLATRTFGRN